MSPGHPVLFGLLPGLPEKMSSVPPTARALPDSTPYDVLRSVTPYDGIGRDRVTRGAVQG